MRKIFGNKHVARILFACLLIVTMTLLSRILRIKSINGVDQARGMYLQPRNSIDVAMVGSSHVHCGVNTGLLYSDYGIAAYDYSGAEQPLWMTYYYLIELYKYQNPKVVVLDLYAPARLKPDYKYDWIAENIHGMRLSLNKLRMLQVSVEPDHLGDYFPSFAVYHDRYDSLTSEDFQDFPWNEKEKQKFKGYIPMFGLSPEETPTATTEVAAGLTEKSEIYLRKIIELTKQHGSTLVFMVVPHVYTVEDKETYNQIEQIAGEESILFRDFNESYAEMDLLFDRDMQDHSHLNYRGSCKFTNSLGLWLKENLEIPDERNVKGYETWEENAKDIANYAAAQTIE